MSAKQPACTKWARHKWVWVKDITVTRSAYGPYGASHRISARAAYKCECGGRRIGASKGGLQ